MILSGGCESEGFYHHSSEERVCELDNWVM